MNEIIISNFKEFVDYIEKYKGTHYFRGQANSQWEIRPNIFRDDNKLKGECEYINEVDLSNSIEIFTHILHLQHYGNGTRLCDLSINPIVGLYFALEDTTQDDCDSAVYVLDNSNSITVDSDEMKLLLFLTKNDIDTVEELIIRFSEISKKGSDRDFIIKSISDNYIVNYDKNVSCNNRRALLQGGTGIYFGFDIDEKKIKRKNTRDLPMIVDKVIIPYSTKSDIRNSLSAYGFKRDVLYDDVRKKLKKLEYEVIEVTKNKFADFYKICLDVILSDIAFVHDDICEISNKVFQDTKLKYGLRTRVFLYVYYDEQDKRQGNWISTIKNSSDFLSFTLKFNNDYHAKRMTYYNEEISIYDITDKTEPIIALCRDNLKSVYVIFYSFSNEEISMELYSEKLQEVRKMLFRPIRVDLQNIYHGRLEFDDYYNLSDIYCSDVMSLIENQISSIKRNDKLEMIKYFFEMNYKQCNDSYQNYNQQRNKLNL